MPSPQFEQTLTASWRFEAIGTQWVIDTVDPIGEGIRNRIGKRIEAFDRTYSRFRADSLVIRMASTPGAYVFPPDSVAIMSWYRKLYEATNGAVTPLIGEALETLGYDKDYSFQSSEARPVVPAWDDVITWDGNIVTTKQRVVLDIGAAGKGYLIDEIGRLLEEYGVSSYVVDASGDVRHRGADDQVVGMEHPDDPTRVIGALKLQNKSLCASATNRRKWGDGLHHVVDGRSGVPTHEVVATWVVADLTMVADGLATALFFARPDTLRSIGSFQFVRMFADGQVEYSKDIMGELFL